MLTHDQIMMCLIHRYGQWNLYRRKMQQQLSYYTDHLPRHVQNQLGLGNSVTRNICYSASFLELFGSSQDYFYMFVEINKHLDIALQAYILPPGPVSGKTESLSSSLVLLQSPSWLLMFQTVRNMSYLDKKTMAMRPKTLLRDVIKKLNATIGQILFWRPLCACNMTLKINWKSLRY